MLRTCNTAPTHRSVAGGWGTADDGGVWTGSGDLTTASSCVREALALTPESPDAIEMRRLIGEARLAQEHERQRAAAVELRVSTSGLLFRPVSGAAGPPAR